MAWERCKAVSSEVEAVAFLACRRALQEHCKWAWKAACKQAWQGQLEPCTLA